MYPGCKIAEMDSIHRINNILEKEYRSPRHGNKSNPVDEVIYIILSQRTNEKCYQRNFRELKKRFKNMESIPQSSAARVARVIYRGGMSDIKAPRIISVMKKIKKDFGRISLNELKKWSGEDALNYLRKLPGIGEKSAYCIMMYSLGFKVFPADVHTIRICNRLGLINEKSNHKKAQKVLARVIPEDMRYSFHVNLVAHGRKICKENNPLCSECSIKRYCKYVKNGKKEA